MCHQYDSWEREVGRLCRSKPKAGYGPPANTRTGNFILMHKPTQPSVAEMVALIQSMPLAPPPEIAERFDPTKVPCVCGKYVPVAECTVGWSGFTNYLVALCPEHLKGLRDCARVVCPRCKTIVLLLEPFIDKHGFEFKKGVVYHVEACPICRPGLKQSAIVEKIVFYKQRGILYCEADQLIL